MEDGNRKKYKCDYCKDVGFIPHPNGDAICPECIVRETSETKGNTRLSFSLTMEDKSRRARCPVCGINYAEDCGYGYHDPRTGEFDCEHPDAEKLECPCIHTQCAECKIAGE